MSSRNFHRLPEKKIALAFLSWMDEIINYLYQKKVWIYLVREGVIGQVTRVNVDGQQLPYI